MNAAGNKRTPKEFPKDYYIKKTKENIGNNIFVSVIVNGKPVRELKGRLEYVCLFEEGCSGCQVP